MIVQGPIDTVLCPLTNILMLHNSRTGNEKRVSGIWSLYPKCLFKCCKWVPWQHLDGSWFALYFHRQRNIKFSFRRHILYWYNKINLRTITNKISKVFVPKARKQHSRNGSHGNTLPEVNCNWYLPSEILHVIFTTIHTNNYNAYLENLI